MIAGESAFSEREIPGSLESCGLTINYKMVPEARLELACC